MRPAHLVAVGLNHDRLVLEPATTANSIKQFDPQVIRADAESTRVIVHHTFPQLVQDFLVQKRIHGSEHEKDLYTEAFTWQDEVARLISKRPLTFMGSSDFTILRDSTIIHNGADEWDRNGTADQEQNQHLTLAEYLSYDEIMLSSLVGVSGHSYFINDGSRHNRARRSAPGTFQERGVIVGLVGARFERRDRMDSVLALPYEPKHQHPEITSLFRAYFGIPQDTTVPAVFNKRAYMARMRITVDMLLLEANDRASETEQMAYAYVVGLGLGVWQYHPDQPALYIDTFTEALSSLSLPSISSLEFAWIDVDALCAERVTAAGRKQNIRVVFSRRNPAEELDTDELLVLSYAWDANAFPGNEYWAGDLVGSGDPAAACMSTIAELHNPLVNDFTHRLKVLEPLALPL